MTGAAGPGGGTGADYGSHFVDRAAVRRYLCRYDPGSDSVDRRIWAVQRDHLVGLVRASPAGRPSGRLLDYACGGGRVLAALAEHVGEAHGWDASQAMLDECAAAVPAARLHRVDLSRQPPPAGPFDLITVFRLFLNLEPDRRAVVFARLAGLLAPGGLLVFDNHGNRRSARHLAVRYGRAAAPFRNEWSDPEVRALVAAAGLVVLDRRGYGWLPDGLHRNRRCRGWAGRLEQALLARTTTPALAIRVLYVAARRPPAAGPQRRPGG